jgi:potassium-transporting ATPase potassium-binding subunit
MSDGIYRGWNCGAIAAGLSHLRHVQPREVRIEGAMQQGDFIQIALFVIVLLLLTPVLGKFMARVFTGERHFLARTFGWAERSIYRLCGINSDEEMNWRKYCAVLIYFNLAGFLVVFALQLVQQLLPLNPRHLGGVPIVLAFNTAVSFMTNTNWQAYAGETTLSYLTQMLGLAVQNFLSAATGIAVLLALIRGLVRRSGQTLGNFWVDLTRSTLYVLLPLSIILAVALVGQGVVQTTAPHVTATTIEGDQQVIPLGPAASQIAIKQLGTNGGGFFNTNSTHPFENPTPLSNFLEMLSILLIPAALVYTFGIMTQRRRHAWVLFSVMMIIFLAGLAVSLGAENSMNGPSANLEGKEIRLGITNSILWETATTCASNGSVNAMHSSLAPIAGGVAMFNMMLGEIVFGGVGCGMYGMLLFVLLTVFLAGLMVGRTPEYLGKKIEAGDIQMVILAIIAPSAAILVGAGLSVVLPTVLSSLGNPGPHGLSEILYAFSSAAGNNGSAFAGLNANTTYYNLILGLVMLIGRFAVLIPTLAIAGRLVGKKIAPASAGTFSTDAPTFAVLLIGVIIIVGALTFFPALTLGPIVEHLLMQAGRTF